MSRPNRSTQERIDWVKKRKAAGMHNTDIKLEFEQAFGNTKDSFYRVLAYLEGRAVKDEKPISSRIAGRLGELEKCYFCENKSPTW